MAGLYIETITAMTTIFTPPADCANSWTYEDAFYDSVDGGLLIQNMDSLTLDEICFPTEFGGNGRAPSSIQVYSPGACPEGYATPDQFQNDGTTTTICCPSLYSYGSTYSTINFFSDSSVLFMGCISQFSGATTVSARANDTEIEGSGDISMWAQPIMVEYQERDLSLFGSSTSTDDATSEPPSGSTISTVDLPTTTFDAYETTGSDPSSPNQPPLATTSPRARRPALASELVFWHSGWSGALFFFIRRKWRNVRKTGQQGAYHAQDSKEPIRQPADWERRELDASEAAQSRSELDGGPMPGSQGGKGDPRLKQQPGQYSELE